MEVKREIKRDCEARDYKTYATNKVPKLLQAILRIAETSLSLMIFHPVVILQGVRKVSNVVIIGTFRFIGVFA